MNKLLNLTLAGLLLAAPALQAQIEINENLRASLCSVLSVGVEMKAFWAIPGKYTLVGIQAASCGVKNGKTPTVFPNAQ